MAVANRVMEEAEARIGRTIRGKWCLDRVIGVGGTAAVYEAHHRNGSRVAVKVLHHHVALSPEQLIRFQREGDAANRVGHPAVTVVYDDDVDEDGCPFLVMDLLHGETLAARVEARGGILPPKEVLSLTVRLLDVLVAAHAQGILHRDIKPQNLFLTNEGELKVLDFGIARVTALSAAAAVTEVGTLLGTPAFVPPEQARGRPDQMDARSDLWSVGATMYTLLTGRHVHQASTSTEQLGLAMMVGASSLADAMPSAPKGLVFLVDRALAYSREDRWPDALAMRDAVRWLVERWEGPETTFMDLPVAWSQTHSSEVAETSSVVTGDAEGPPERRPKRRGVAVLLLALCVGAVFVVIWRTALPVNTVVGATPTAPSPISSPRVQAAPPMPAREPSEMAPARAEVTRPLQKDRYSPSVRKMIAAPQLRVETRPAVDPSAISEIPFASPPPEVPAEPSRSLFDRRH